MFATKNLNRALFKSLYESPSACHQSLLITGSPTHSFSEGRLLSGLEGDHVVGLLFCKKPVRPEDFLEPEEVIGEGVEGVGEVAPVGLQGGQVVLEEIHPGDSTDVTSSGFPIHLPGLGPGWAIHGLRLGHPRK